MKNYNEIDNFEINKLVFKALNPGNAIDINPARNVDSELVGLGVTVRGVFKSDLVTEFRYYDYCNNPSDAWPIIVENGINIIRDYDIDEGYWAMDGWLHHSDSIFDSLCSHSDKNPLRAAMICFLKMKDAE